MPAESHDKEDSGFRPGEGGHGSRRHRSGRHRGTRAGVASPPGALRTACRRWRGLRSSVRWSNNSAARMRSSKACSNTSATAGRNRKAEISLDAARVRHALRALSDRAGCTWGTPFPRWSRTRRLDALADGSCCGSKTSTASAAGPRSKRRSMRISTGWALSGRSRSAGSPTTLATIRRRLNGFGPRACSTDASARGVTSSTTSPAPRTSPLRSQHPAL